MKNGFRIPEAFLSQFQKETQYKYHWLCKTLEVFLFLRVEVDGFYKIGPEITSVKTPAVSAYLDENQLCNMIYGFSFL